MAKVYKFVVSFALCISAGFIAGSVANMTVDTWYPALDKPWFNPPNYVFTPVWIVLYLMMGVSLYLVLSSKVREGKKTAAALFALQLVFNVFWAILFFGFKSPGLALIDIVALFVSIAATLWFFFRISGIAGLLLIPYLAWVGFAMVLNFEIMMMNR